MGTDLARALNRARSIKGKSLRAVADPAGISPTYLQKLERGDVRDPSPNVLYRLSEQLDLSYGDLMQRAGYVVPTIDHAPTTPSGSPGRPVSHALSSEPLTEEEETALASYLGFLRSQKGPPA